MDCKSRLEKYFRDNGIKFETMTHAAAYTAQELAAAQKVPGKQFAKVVMVVGDGQIMMLVLPASHHIDFRKLKGVLKVKDVRLAKEEEFSLIFPDCETGAMPPFGNWYGVPIHIDQALSEGQDIVFQAGTHKEMIRLSYRDYAILTQPAVSEFAMHS